MRMTWWRMLLSQPWRIPLHHLTLALSFRDVRPEEPEVAWTHDHHPYDEYEEHFRDLQRS